MSRLRSWRARRARHYTPRMRRERRRRRLRALATAMLVAGALALADVGLTLVWQEPVTTLLGRGDRAQQETELTARSQELRSAQVRGALAELRGDEARLRFLARRAREEARRGEAVGRLRIPRMDLDDPVVWGTSSADLREGPAFFPDQALPGTRGTVAIAGHRTTYGAPFRHLDRLGKGDLVTVRMPFARFDYRVSSSRIVAPDELSVLRRRARDRLVLSACHPLFSAAERIVVSADLVRVRAKLDGRPIDLDGSSRFVGQPASAAQGLRGGPPMR